MEDKLLIDVARLDPEGETITGAVNDDVLEMDGELLRPFGGIRYELFVQLFGTELLVRGKLEQDFDAVCCRCGGDFDFTTKIPDFTASFEINEKTEIFDLTDELRQCIILDLPSFPVCRQDCLGVCSICGKNLNEGSCECDHTIKDDRWGGIGCSSIGEIVSLEEKRRKRVHHGIT